jgi:regulator of protease activity HflC (stomatin/prohibitin superfamily)
MGFAILAGVFLLAGLTALIAAFIAMPRTVSKGKAGERPNYARRWLVLSAVIAIVIAPVIFVRAGINSVPTKSVGVVTSFGRVGSEYAPGAHWLVPWQSLNVIQDTIQSDNFAQANGTGADSYGTSGAIGNCITVRLGGNQEGCADVQLQTQVEPSAIPALFANYSSYGGNLTAEIDQHVVKRELVTVLNHTLGDYNPVADVSTTLNSNAASQFSSFDPSLLAQMKADLGGQVTILNINLQYVHYDSATQDRINQIATQYADTQVAKQQESTNAAISLANAALAKQNSSLSPAVLQNECYQTIQLAIKAGFTGLPATLSCGPGTTASVLVPGK